MSLRRMFTRRPGYLYEFWGYDPRALLRGVVSIICIYVGQTRQKPENRWRQHEFGTATEGPKVWWPLVTEKRVTYRRMKVTGWWLDRREDWRVLKLRPVANILLNMENTQRIPPWEMCTLMESINRMGGVDELVRRYGHRGQSTAGWSFAPDGSVTWYGAEAQRLRDALEMSKGA